MKGIFVNVVFLYVAYGFILSKGVIKYLCCLPNFNYSCIKCALVFIKTFSLFLFQLNSAFFDTEEQETFIFQLFLIFVSLSPICYFCDSDFGKNIKRQKSRNFCRKSDFKEEPVLRMLAFLTFIFVLQVYIGKVGQIHLTARSSMETYNCFNFFCNNFVHFLLILDTFWGILFRGFPNTAHIQFHIQISVPLLLVNLFINFHQNCNDLPDQTNLFLLHVYVSQS